jgi:multidrug efflux pump subunit AcrA (membrane-fusion protein)
MMTDDELRSLVEGLAISQAKTDQEIDKLVASQIKTDAQMAKTDAQMAKTDAQMAKTNVQLAKTNAQLAKTDAQLAKTDAQLAKTDAQLAKTDAQLAKTDAQLAKTDTKLDKLAKMYGGVGNSQGAVAEEFYFNSLKANPVLNGIHFDSIDKNLTRNQNGLEDEFDILMVNGKDVFIIEVKYKAHEEDLRRLIEKKAVNFKKLFPVYRGYNHHLGLATFHIYDELKDQALSAGVTVLQRRGDVITVSN